MPFYNSLKSNHQLLKQLLRKLFEALDLLQYHNIVHADLKPDNMLVEFDGTNITSLKLIDFGSAFYSNCPCNIRMSTAEYLSPECLEYQHTSKSQKVDLCERVQSWSIDMWSAGAIFLEILTGFPLWLSLKGRVETEGKSLIAYGIFAVQGKVESKILQKQKEVVKKLKEMLSRYNCFITDPDALNLLEKLLDLNPMKRISPKEALNHPYLNK